MRIVLINSLFGPTTVVGGAERYVELLAHELSHDHEVTVVALQPLEGIDQGNLGGIPVVYMGLRNLYWPFDYTTRSPLQKMVWHLLDAWNPAMALGIKAILEDLHPDIVHTHNLTGFSTAVWGRARQLKIPIIHTLYDYSLLCPKSTMFRNGRNCRTQCLVCRLYSSIRMEATSMVEAVAGVSQFTLQRHLDLGAFRKARIRTVVRTEPEFGESAVTMRAKSSKLRLGFMGRLHPAKGVESLLACVKTLDDPGVELLVAGVGSADCERDLRSLFQGEAIHFAGYMSRDRFYTSIDVLVVPSLWHEPMGRVVVDAWGRGIPVIATRRGGITEFVAQHDAGWLYEPDAPGELGSIILDLRHHPEVIARKRQAIMRQVAACGQGAHGNYLAIYEEVVRSAKQ